MSGFSERMKQKEDADEADADEARLTTPENLGLTEDEVADVFADMYQNSRRFDASTKRWYKWVGTHWKIDITKTVIDDVRKLVRDLATTKKGKKDSLKIKRLQFARNVVGFAETDRRLVVEADHWDPDPYLLGTPGDTVNLRTGEMREPDPNDRITKITAVTPSTNADATQWKKFVHEATGGDEKLATFLQRAMGYTLTGDTSEHLLVFIYGNGGNGKGVFLNTVSRIMWDYHKEAPMDVFTAKKFRGHSTDLAMLHGARLVTSTETSVGSEWDDALVKKITGGDPMSARFIGKDNFMFTPQLQLIVVGNNQPRLRTVDDAMRRRLVMIPFENKPKRKDPKLPEKLRAEWPGILRWMIDGAVAWHKEREKGNDGLVIPDAVRVATSEYFDGEDVFGQFLADRIEAFEADLTSPALNSDDVFRAWVAYAETADETPGNKRQFMKMMRGRGHDKTRESSGKTLFVGLRLRGRSGGQPGGID